MRDRLSSSVTPLFRTVIPLVWTAGLGISVATVWLAPFAVPPARWAQVLLTATWIVGGILLLRLRRRLRHVWIDDDALIVSGRRGERIIPLRAVDAVREIRLSNPRMVHLRVRRSNGSEARFAYVARWELASPFSAHSDVRRLRARIHALRAEQANPPRAGVPVAR